MNLLDGGARSRKFWLSVGTQVGIVVTALICAKIPALIPLFDTMVGGLVGVLALYSGANIGAKAVLMKKPGVSSVEASPVDR